MKESYDCDCGVCSICNGQRKPTEPHKDKEVSIAYQFDAEICEIENNSTYITNKDNTGDNQYFEIEGWKYGNCKVKIIVIPE